MSHGPKAPNLPKNKIEYHPAKPGYYLVPKEDVNQSNIHMVALGTTRNNPDYYAISVFNEAFGGGFSSRLFNDIRTKRGLPTTWAAVSALTSGIPAFCNS